MAAMLQIAVAEGDYDSSSDAIQDILWDWQKKLQLRAERLAVLKRDIDVGLKDIEEGRIVDFDLERLIAIGRQRLAARSRFGQR
jgi:antitoxin ParD1/3/4